MAHAPAIIPALNLTPTGRLPHAATSQTPPPEPKKDIVPALIGGARVYIECPEWCTVDHVATSERCLADLSHASTFADLHVPTGGREFLFHAALFSMPYAEEDPDSPPHMFVDDERQDGIRLDADGATEFADRLITMAAQVRRMAQALSPSESTPPAPRPTGACPVEWCGQLGPHQGHTSNEVAVQGPNGTDAYLIAELIDIDASGAVHIGFEASEWVGLDAAGLRAEVAKLRAHLPRLEALAATLDTIESNK
ncbi:DUF6907 domain-containing protein [Streptomyces iconiensis]